MGILDKSVSQKDFDSFKSEIQKQIAALSDELKHTASDSEDEARVSAENAQAIENKIQGIEANVEANLKELESYTNGAKTEFNNMKTERETLSEKNQEITTKIQNIENLASEANELKESIDSVTTDVHENVAKLNTALSDSEALPSQVEEIKQLLETTKELNVNMEDLQSHSMKRKSEIDNLYKDIYGHDITNNENETEHIEGLKDELEKAYTHLTGQSDEIKEVIKESIDSISTTHQESLEQDKANFETLIEESKTRVQAVKDQLTSLLPGAMAEGLSSAYETKKQDEIKTQESLELSFKLSISLLVAISLIPFGVDIYLLLWMQADLVQVIKDTPSLLVAIFPIYFPVLWLAYSSNKKMNLSKRLIEEYTHKAVLGKTFDGLSNQIESLPQEGVVRDELRTRLLFNLLQVSSENPGKLITDYDKSDHPLMEALENSSKLSDSVKALLKVPGFSSIANKLAEKSEKILEKEERKIADGLEAQEVFDEEAEKQTT